MLILISYSNFHRDDSIFQFLGNGRWLKHAGTIARSQKLGLFLRIYVCRIHAHTLNFCAHYKKKVSSTAFIGCNPDSCTVRAVLYLLYENQLVHFNWLASEWMWVHNACESEFIARGMKLNAMKPLVYATKKLLVWNFIDGLYSLHRPHLDKKKQTSRTLKLRLVPVLKAACTSQRQALYDPLVIPPTKRFLASDMYLSSYKVGLKIFSKSTESTSRRLDWSQL